ncbi:putative DNA binding domain-containing protein [bacterium]|nr:putative DNA binding domain-containing protein [bacterium]
MLPFSIEELIEGKIIESERIEFKKGWNPEPIIHTITAFANDLHNWGGGYIIIGIEEIEGKIVDIPGLSDQRIEKIQKELNGVCRKIIPNYFPKVFPETYKGQGILVIYVPAGEARPYKCAETLGKKGVQYHYYTRFGNNTIKANHEQEKELFSLSEDIPFDDRINIHAEIEDIDHKLVIEFLSRINSNLISEGPETYNPLELCKSLNIVREQNGQCMPLNIALMMFSPDPEKFFPYSRIEVNHFKDAEGTQFTEKNFKGPINKQLSNALDYINTNFINENVKKVDEQAESLRFHNYPFKAIEETLANAIYHRDYSVRETVEVNIRPDRIEVLSRPGPLPPLIQKDFEKEKVIPRSYRNRRIGDFLKELHLTEGKCTGIPTIWKEMERNGSPKPVFKTDEYRAAFFVTLPIHPLVIKEGIPDSPQVTPQVTPQDENGIHLTKLETKILDLIKSNNRISRKQIAVELGISPDTVKEYIRRLRDKKVIDREGKTRSGKWIIL